MADQVEAGRFRWTEVAEDHPIDLLSRRMIVGDQVLAAHVRLQPGCHVAPHRHDSEQIAIVVSGRARWTLGEGDLTKTIETVAGDVVHLPSNVLHGVDALEETLIYDILSPPGPMGVDSQRS